MNDRAMGKCQEQSAGGEDFAAAFDLVVSTRCFSKYLGTAPWEAAAALEKKEIVYLRP